MADKNDYVAPPGVSSGQSDYVAPPGVSSGQSDYVAPPGQTVQQNDYVTPLSVQSSQQSDYVTPPGAQGTKQSDYVPPQQGQASSHQEQGYFDTPSAPWTMYLTGYLFIMLMIVWNGENGLFMKLLGTAYTLLSNYTLSWYSDYKRFENGPFAWFFTRFGSAKFGYASSASMNYQKVRVSRGVFGNYTGTSSTDWGQHILTAVIVTVVAELLRFFICIPIAFITLFTHKTTVAKYTYALQQWLNQQ